jgi:phosphatidylserine decarboxylase
MSAAEIDNPRIRNKFPVAREGLPFIFIGVVLTSLLLFFDFMVPAILSGILTLFTIYFFRDPHRENKFQENAILTPADGKILDIQHLNDGNNYLGEPAVKVSIFMSIFNVHVNRIPVSGRISRIMYHPGTFFSANLDKASEKNEHNRVTLQTGDGRKVVFVQIAGMIARRIVCWIKEGDLVGSGQRFGLIRFGSRLDIYVPDDSRIIVQPRLKVKAGETILGYLS